MPCNQEAICDVGRERSKTARQAPAALATPSSCTFVSRRSPTLDHLSDKNFAGMLSARNNGPD
jgi:hypothetical protein